MTKEISALLESWLHRHLDAEASRWLTDQLKTLNEDQSTRTFDISFGMIPRKLGKADLNLKDEDILQAQQLRKGWDPSRWSVDVAARILILLKVSPATNLAFHHRFAELRRTADLSELLALYYGLPLYDSPETLVEHAVYGLRTNIRSEFEAIAHRNPFPAEFFEQNPWNNMVLKALFIGAMLEPIQGLDERANPELASILRDYAHERWAAERPVSPELWRCIGPYATDAYLDDFQRVIDDEGETSQKAIALALRSAPDSARKSEMSRQLAKYDAELDRGTITWTSIANEMLDNSLATTRKLNTEVELTR